MAKTPRTEIVGVRFTPEERQQIEKLAERMGRVSLSDCVRSATKMYMRMRLDPLRCNKYLIPLWLELLKSGELTEMDLTAEESRRSHRRP